jgi:hypothetical protein
MVFYLSVQVVDVCFCVILAVGIMTMLAHVRQMTSLQTATSLIFTEETDVIQGMVNWKT